VSVNPTEITAWGGLILLALTGIAIPWWNRRRDAAAKLRDDEREEEARKLAEVEKTGTAAVLNWTNFTSALQAERNELRKQLDEIEGRHRQQLKDVEQSWEERNTLLRARITELETDMASLERRLTAALSRGGA
jgi:hypothetical protein